VSLHVFNLLGRHRLLRDFIDQVGVLAYFLERSVVVTAHGHVLKARGDPVLFPPHFVTDLVVEVSSFRFWVHLSIVHFVLSVDKGGMLLEEAVLRVISTDCCLPLSRPGIILNW